MGLSSFLRNDLCRRLSHISDFTFFNLMTTVTSGTTIWKQFWLNTISLVKKKYIGVVQIIWSVDQERKDEMIKKPLSIGSSWKEKKNSINWVETSFCPANIYLLLHVKLKLVGTEMGRFSWDTCFSKKCLQRLSQEMSGTKIVPRKVLNKTSFFCIPFQFQYPIHCNLSVKAILVWIKSFYLPHMSFSQASIW